MKPSGLYRADLWRAGLLAARLVPASILRSLGGMLALAYWRQNRVRREIVFHNLLPALQFDRSQAEQKCRELFRNFGIKLADLWRYEAGHPTSSLICPADHWNVLQAAHQRGRGLLLVTAHIGNWEFGAPFLREKGINLQVITQAEPQESLTKMRQASRSRWGIETLVIGENPFAFVEVIRRLEGGAAVALLIDRPPAPSAVTVKLFGHRFPASIAAAELARATGCALLPVCLPRVHGGYSVELLPEIHYDRAALGTREARANLTQEIMKQFEPMIRRHLDQWFHFVPVWAKEEQV